MIICLRVTSSFLRDFAELLTPKKSLFTLLYRKSRDKLASSDIKLSSRIRGFQESEDMDEKVGMIIKELGFSKQYQVMGRIGGLRKRGAEERGVPIS